MSSLLAGLERHLVFKHVLQGLASKEYKSKKKIRKVAKKDLKQKMNSSIINYFVNMNIFSLSDDMRISRYGKNNLCNLWEGIIVLGTHTRAVSARTFYGNQITDLREQKNN